MFSSTRSYASLMSVLPRSKRNQFAIAVARLLGCWVTERPKRGASATQQLRNPATQHAEHPKPRRINARVVRNRQSESQIHTRLGGIDHAVVPEARGRVIRAALLLVLGEHGI